MKKILVAAVLLFAGIASTFAGDRERPIAVDKLPAVAQQFLAAHFKGADRGLRGGGPEVHRLGVRSDLYGPDRSGFPFRRRVVLRGRKYEAVPASVVPAQIQEYVAKSNFPNQYIRKIERNKYTWEIELSNGLEIKFDRQFNVIGFDD